MDVFGNAAGERRQGLPGTPSILIIDDSPGNRITFRAVLEPLGHPIDLADSGLEGLKQASQKEYSVILLDVRMPMMNGFEVAESIRQKGLNRETPIIFVSGYDFTPMHVQKGYLAGATDYLINPVDEKVLRHKVAAFVQLSERHRSLKAQLHQMGELVAALHQEVSECKPAQEALTRRVAELERAMSEIRRELSPYPAIG